MALLILSIGSLEYIMDLLAEVLNAFNEVVIPFRLQSGHELNLPE